MSSEEMSLLERADEYASMTWRAFPFETALCIMAALTINCPKFRGYEPWTMLLQLLTWAALSFVGCFGLTILRRIGAIRRRERLQLSVAWLLFLAAVIWLFVDFDHDTTPWRLMMLAAALGCALPLTLLRARDTAGRDTAGREQSIWRMTLTTLQRGSTVSLYSGAVLVALSLAVAAIHDLFDLDLTAYSGHLAIWICVAFAPLVAIRQTARDLTHPSPIDNVSDQQLSFLARYLLLPTLLTYLAIIFAYTAKVMVTGEASRNMLSPLVLVAEMIGLGVIFVYEPMARRNPQAALSKWVRALPWLLLGALPLAGWAICERIIQHGWTEFRYARLLAVAGLAITFGWAIYQRRYRKTVALYTAPAVFAALFALASFGPWSISEVSEASQQHRVQLELEDTGVSASPTISLTDLERANIDTATRTSVRSRLRYLSKHHGEEAAAELFGSEEARRYLEQ